MHFVNNRWLGGMLTNFSTIKGRIRKCRWMCMGIFIIREI